MKPWFLLVALMLAQSALAIEAQVLNRLIKNNNGQWIAKDFPRSYKMGLSEAPIGMGLFEDRSLALEVWDWRDVNGANWIGAVLDQGNCGSCVAFAAIATLEAQYKITAGLSWLDPQFSPQQLFNCGGGSCSLGWQLGAAAKKLKKQGVVDAACVPYESGSTGENIQCLHNFCERQSERVTKIYDYSSPSSWGGSAAKVKAALKKGPVMTGMTVYEDFMSYSSGIYKSFSKKSLGGHAVSIVGFNDIQRYWIIRNSWGKEWGEGGFARISYDDKSGIGESTYAFELNPSMEYLAITSPLNREFLSGSKSIVVELTEASPSEIILRGQGELIKFNACDDTGSKICQLQLDTTQLKDGRYEVYAQSNGKKSATKEFFVLNSLLATELTFSGAPGVELSLPQRGRIELLIDVKSLPVMPKEMEMVILDEKGVVVKTMLTNDVYSKMRIGLRTNLLGNGQYTIFFRTRTPLGAKEIVSHSNRELLTVLN